MEEGSSKLLFTGLISPYLVLLMFVIAVGLTVYLYKKHRLPRPWNVILPRTPHPGFDDVVVDVVTTCLGEIQ